MHWKNLSIIVLLIIFIDILCVEADVEEGVDAEIPITKKINKPINGQSGQGSNFGGSSPHNNAVVAATYGQFNVTRMIINPKRYEGYFKNEDTIEVVVSITSLKKDYIDNIEIWEIPEDSLGIINCSYPIRSSSIKDILDYEDFDNSYLRENDILNISSLKNTFLNDTQREKNYALNYIYNMLSKETRNCLKSNSTNSSKTYQQLIVYDLNKIINTSGLIDSNDELKKLKYFSAKSLDQSELPNTNEFNNSCEYRITNRRVLENLFPEAIRKLSICRKHESLKIDSDYNSIKIVMDRIYPREAIVFKYYLHPNELGLTAIRSIVRTMDFIKEDYISLNIIERSPRFDIGYLCPTKALIRNQSVEFDYSIKYLGGDDEEKNFTIKFSPVNNRGSGTPYCTIENKSELTIYKRFLRGKAEIFPLNVTYNLARPKLSPPSVSVGNDFARFEADISVYENEDMLEKYESKSLYYQEQSNNLAFLLSIIAIISAFTAVVEICFILWETREMKKEREKTMRIMNKILGD